MASQSLNNRYLADPDVQLMLRIAGGDQQAFERLVERYQDRLVGFFFHMFRDRTIADDLAQEAFLRIYRAREKYQPTARLSTWVFRIAHNLASNRKRGLARRKEVQFSTTGSEAEIRTDELIPEKSGMMPVRRLDSIEMQELVRKALDDLNERQKTVVLLHKFEGLSYEDIGEVMGLGVVAVKSLLSRARANLKENLAKYMS